MSVASAPSSHAFFATTPKGLESLLLAELAALGAAELRETRAGVAFHGPLALAYRACLWSRLANSIQQPLADFAAPTPEALYAGAQTIAWEDHFCADDTLAVDFATVQSQISHSHFGALKVKAAIVDRFRAREGRRPSVEREQPRVRINVYLHRDHATVYLGLSGGSAVERERRLRRIDSRTLARGLGAGWHAGRSALRRRHTARRRRDDGGRYRAGAPARVLRIPRMARPRRDTVVAAHRRGRDAARGGAATAAEIIRLRRGRACGAGGAAQCRGGAHERSHCRRTVRGAEPVRARGRRTRPRDLQSAVRRTPRRRRDIDAAVRRARREIEDGIHRLARRRAHRQSRSRQKDGAARAQAVHALQRRARMQALVLRRHARVVRHRSAH